MAALAWKNVPVSELWRYIAGGFAVILAAWFTWLPLGVLHFFVDFIFYFRCKGWRQRQMAPAQWLAKVARHRPRLFIHWQPLSSRVPITGAV